MLHAVHTAGESACACYIACPNTIYLFYSLYVLCIISCGLPAHCAFTQSSLRLWQPKLTLQGAKHPLH